MKNTVVLLCCICIALVCCLPVCVFAHSGRTDGSGGHTDSYTGEYHYHHGYPAHDHWDIDGDGIIDCPHKFDDKTTQSKGQTSSNNGVSSSINQSGTSIPKKEEESKVPTWVYVVIGILVFVIICMYQIIRGKNKTIEENERSFRMREKDAETRVKEGLSSLHNALVEKYGKDYLYEISGAPEGDFLGADELPHSSGALKSIYLDQYTFYLGGASYSRSDAKYHHRSCRYARSSYPINAIHLKRNRHYWPCMICRCGLPDTVWVEVYKKHLDFLSKYIDKKILSPLPTPPNEDAGIKIDYRNNS